MKFNIFNYSSPQFLQPIYLNEEINKIPECESAVSNDKTSVYYVYDRFKPDISIINIMGNIRDCIHYNQNTDKKINHIVNIDYLAPSQTKDVVNFFKKDEDLQCRLVISSNLEHKNIDFGVPFVHVQNCANENIPMSKKAFEINKLIVINKPEEKNTYEGTQHFISIGLDKNNTGADFSLNSMEATTIFPSYDEIIFRNIKKRYIPESFFNALYFGNCNVYFQNDDEQEAAEVQEMLGNILCKKTNFDYNKKEDYFLDEIKSKVREKHTAKNRLKQILSNIKEAQDVIKRL